MPYKPAETYAHHLEGERECVNRGKRKKQTQLQHPPGVHLPAHIGSGREKERVEDGQKQIGNTAASAPKYQQERSNNVGAQRHGVDCKREDSWGL